MGVKENLSAVRKQIEQAAKKSGRCAEDIVLVGISKTAGVERVKEAIGCGLADIGENRVQEAEKKFPLLSGVRKHFVGHLQSNKVKKAVEIFDVIQSVDSIEIARKIDEQALRMGKTMPILVQVCTDERKEFGIRLGEIEKFIRKAAKLEGTRVLGLMTIGPAFENPEDSRRIFRETKKLFDSLARIPHVEMRYLSMGMSFDFTIAIEEGANMVRVGRALFG